MKKHLLALFAASSLAGAAPALVLAQDYDRDDRSSGAKEIGEGSGEFSLSGAGTSDKDFDRNIFNLNVTLGQYMSEGNLVGIRQSASANNNQDEEETDWNGSTRIFYDYHFDAYPWRPLVGVSAGYIYGETVDETWIAGPELGVKYYIHGNTFVAALVEYQFLFDDADEADDQFDDGVYIYSMGVGINF